MEKGYYIVKHYNYESIKINFFNGNRFEKFPSDSYTNDEIEWFKKIDYEIIKNMAQTNTQHPHHAIKTA